MVRLCKGQVTKGSLRKRKLISVEIFARDSRVENGCANFIGAWDFCFFLQKNLHVHIKTLFRGGGGYLYWGFWGVGGRGANFILMGAGIFLPSKYSKTRETEHLRRH